MGSVHGSGCVNTAGPFFVGDYRQRHSTLHALFVFVKWFLNYRRQATRLRSEKATKNKDLQQEKIICSHATLFCYCETLSIRLGTVIANRDV